MMYSASSRRRPVVRTLVVAALLLVGAGVSSTARANCLTDHFANQSFNNVRYFRLVLVTDNGGNGGWVSYSNGVFYTQNSTSVLANPVGQIFSDRFNGSQPFYQGSSDSMSVTMNSNGLMSVHNITWNFDWSVTLSCAAGSNHIMVGNAGGTEVVLTVGSALPLP